MFKMKKIFERSCVYGFAGRIFLFAVKHFIVSHSGRIDVQRNDLSQIKPIALEWETQSSVTLFHLRILRSSSDRSVCNSRHLSPFPALSLHSQICHHMLWMFLFGLKSMDINLFFFFPLLPLLMVMLFRPLGWRSNGAVIIPRLLCWFGFHCCFRELKKLFRCYFSLRIPSWVSGKQVISYPHPVAYTFAFRFCNITFFQECN